MTAASALGRRMGDTEAEPVGGGAYTQGPGCPAPLCPRDPHTLVHAHQQAGPWGKEGKLGIALQVPTGQTPLPNVSLTPPIPVWIAIL